MTCSSQTEGYGLIVSCLPVGFVHQVGQVQLALLCQWGEVLVMLEEV